ncbi:Pectate lyase [Paenibacillus sp. 1_12]|uniref:pectinesterase family protein n=1 Tax=Paenibacillus sp. 1_12 TaxID=1566278 RepID=UPI0008F15ECF|nr:pectinesterase family protein [Paenibacillus sp. 1_12]SFM13148.1 Pectate lyase [Paenibacillus sp. 1_12]
MFKNLRIMLCLLLVASCIPLWSMPVAEAAAAVLPTGGASGWNGLSFNGNIGTSTYDKTTGTYTVANTTSNGVTNSNSTTEQFQYAYTPISGDFTMIARLATYDYLSSAQTGILVRSNLSQQSSFVYGYLYGGGTNYQPYVSTKTTMGTAAASNSGYKVSSVDKTYTTSDLPQYMRVRKQWQNSSKTDVYYDLGTSDGTTITWTNINGKSITDANVLQNQTMYVGFAVGKAPISASFDSVTVINSYIGNTNPTLVASLTLVAPTPTAVPADGQVALSWNNVTNATYYNVYRSTSSGGTYTKINTSQISSTSYIDTAVTNGQNYFYIVKSANSLQESVSSDEVSARPAIPAAIAAPTTFTATAGNASVVLAWSSVSEATNYKIKRGSASGGPYTDLTTVTGTTYSYTDSSVVNGTTYYYVVSALKAAVESANSNQAAATPVAQSLPTSPSNLVTWAGDAQMSLSWGSVSGAASYNVKRSVTAGGPYTTIATNVTGTSFNNTGLTNGTAYYYVVSAVNVIGEGVNSNEVSGRPGAFLINDDFENSTLGAEPNGYISIANAADVAINNISVINNNNLTNKYYSPTEALPANNKSVNIPGNSTNVFWINDNANASRRGGFTNTFTTISGKKGLTAQLDFMEPTLIGDSYPLELLDSSGKTVLSLSVTNLGALTTVSKGIWYNLKFVTDTGTNTADFYMNGVYKGNYTFTTQDTNIAKLQARTAGSSLGSLYLDNIKVYQQAVTIPQKLTAGGGNNISELNWNAASGVDAYNVYRSSASGGTYILVASNVPSNSYTDTGLANDINYYYKVTAVSASGESEYSNETFATPNSVAPPEAPTGLSAVVRDSQITLNWNSSTNATYYTLQRSTTPNGPFTQLLLNGSQKLTGTTYLDTNLTDGTPYYYQIAAGNIGGLSPFAGFSNSQTTVTPTAPLDTPVLLNAMPTNNKVDLSWSSVKQATYYNVKRSTVNGGPYTTIAANVNGTSYLDSTAANSTTYYYVVTAANTWLESMISNQLKATPYAPVLGAPNKPTGFVAIADDGSVKLSWNAISGVTSYNVKRGTVSGGPYSTVASSTQASYEDNAVINGTTYYYVVSAVNTNGESPVTDEIIVLPAKVLTVDKTAIASATVFNTIQSAVNAIPTTNTTRTVIYIKAGTYTEKLVINSPYVSLVGEGIDKTTIVYGNYAGTTATTGQPGHTGSTFLSQTVDVTADYFTASNLTIANSSAPRSAVAQAVALSLKSDKAVFESVKLVGYQDTLYTGLNSTSKGRHYFHNSIIQGDVDFIFGEAPAVVFDNVKMVLVSNSGGGGHITAGAQKNLTDMGYIFLNSQIIDDTSALGTYDLGRPWKDNAKIRFINTLIDSKKFLASGWISSCAGACTTYSFGEYNSYGPGASPSARQIATQLTGSEASLTIPQIFNDPTNTVVADRTWDPSIPVMMPKTNYLPTVSVTSSSFDKYAAKQADLNVEVQYNGYALTNITNGIAVLGSSDYTASGNVVTLKKAYLAGLSEGTITLSFNFSSGSITIPVPFTVNVVNSDRADIGKQILAVNDGWASYSTGTKGGADADSAHIFTVTNRSELIQALGGTNSSNATNAISKIIYIKGTIDMNVDDNNNPVGFDYYKAPGYDFNAYLAAYDPAVWGKSSVPSGALETARAASETNQGNKIKINVGSNTTIVGLPGSNAKILGGNLMIQNVDNVIVRNIEFQNAFDYFPQWDPTDGDTGNWNSAFDNITLKGATHIWIDRNTFSDGSNPDNYSNTYFGRQYQQHDGLLDITNASDLVTVSYNYFHDHDKTTLVGGSDGFAGDIGKERITFHHNYYKDITQRAPRVRYGQVHLYNNFYEGTFNNPSYPYLYAIGVGYASQIYAQNNYFVEDAGTSASDLIGIFAGGTTFTDTGSVLNGTAVNIAQSKGGLNPVNWTPTLFTTIDATTDVPKMVVSKAGAENTLQRLLSAPSGVVATAVNSQITVKWNSVTGATYYSVKRSTSSNGTFTVIATNVTNPQSYTDVNVTNGNSYYYVVSAVNAAGESADSTVVKATPVAALTPPAAPSEVVATGGNSQVTVKWNSVTGATYYSVKRSTSSNGTFTVIATNVTNPQSYTDVNVTNGNSYYYVVTAVNAAGESADSTVVNATPVAALTPPAAPSGVVATGGNSQVNVKWNSVTGATYYSVKRSTSSNGTFTVIATNVTNPQSYTDMNVTNGNSYYYVVSAVNAAGESADSTVVNATPVAALTPPAAPSGVVATARTASVSLSWNAVNGATGYNVKRSTTSGGPYTTLASNVTGTGYEDTPLANYVTYYYVVSAVIESLEGMDSTEISARSFIPNSTSTTANTSGSNSGGASSTGSQAAAASTDKRGVTLPNVEPIKEQSADGKITLKVNVDAASLQKAFDDLKASNGSIEPQIIINVKGSGAQAKIQLPLDIIAKAQTNVPATLLFVQFDNMTYGLPIQALDVAALSKALGAEVKDLKINITIEKVNKETTGAVEAKAKQSELKLLTAAVDFNVTAEANGKIVSVHDFGQTYVQRTLAIAQTIDFNTTTALLYNPELGEMSFVPATFQVVDGITQVTIKRPGNSIYTVVQSTKSFADLNGHWAKSDVELLASKLVVKGATDTSFAPQNQITRAEFAALLVRSIGLNEASSAKFTDVLASEWYAGAVGAASKAGLVDGFDEVTFKPGATITREQMAVMISRAITISGKKAAADVKGTATFTDSASISTWAKDAVTQSYNAGIINGITDKTFVPNANATRAEAAVMLKRLLQHVEFIN